LPFTTRFSYAGDSVGHELTQMSFNSRVNSVIVSCEFELTRPNRCELWVWFNSVFVWVV